MTWEEVCVELHFHNRSAKMYRKSWEKDKYLVVNPNVWSGLAIMKNGIITDEKLVEEDKRASDWCEKIY